MYIYECVNVYVNVHNVLNLGFVGLLTSSNDWANRSFLWMTSELSWFIAYKWRNENRELNDAPRNQALSKRDPSTTVPVSVINDDARNPPSLDHRVCARAHLSKTILMDSSWWNVASYLASN